jgi:transcriptional regulator with XRE-family HTH domain
MCHKIVAFSVSLRNGTRLLCCEQMNIATSFRELRERTGMSLVALARRTGVDVGALSDLERGKGSTETHVLGKLADVYGVPVEVLAGWCPVPLGLQELLARPGVSIPEARVFRLCRLEFRGGETLSADDWARLSEQLAGTEHC